MNNAFSQSIFELEISGQDQIIAKSINPAQPQYQAHSMHFWSCYVKNIIFRKTSTTHSCFTLKVSSKKLKSYMTSYLTN